MIVQQIFIALDFYNINDSIHDSVITNEINDF